MQQEFRIDDVLSAFVLGVGYKLTTANDSLSTQNGRLFTHGTVLAERRFVSIDGKHITEFELNLTKYTVSETKHLSRLFGILAAGVLKDIRVVSNLNLSIPKGTLRF